ncbi:MAG: response regulator [SAR324 cluster bacterium]|uniref:histidine kinase n=1 Tax=SAR324 cluster bacterium TaxID=2024889 RepID=A0A7X9FR84_9DELT|nr:response regulator [SAR324 cluster bacterium]
MSFIGTRHFRKEDTSIDTRVLFASALLVSNEGNDSQYQESLLSKEVGELLTARSFEDGFAILETQMIEIVIMHSSIDGNSGITFLKRLKSLRPELPIVVIAPISQAHEILSLMQLGAWDYIDCSSKEGLELNIHSTLQRVAETKLSEIDKIQTHLERSAFWAAVHNAPDGLGILGVNGIVLFANKKFLDFCSLILKSPTKANPNFIDLLKMQNNNIALQVQEQLEKEVKNEALWQTEIQIIDENLNQNPSSCSFDLFLSSVTFSEIQGGTSLSTLLRKVSPRLFVMWVRDSTARREQEKRQQELLSITTHDLKGPIGAILGAASLLQQYRENNPENNDGLIQSISSAGRNCLNLIEDLLSAHKMETGAFKIVPAWHDLDEIIESIMKDYESAAKLRKLDFLYTSPSSNIQIYADYLGLQRVLSNLLSNAIKFTPLKGKVWIKSANVDKFTQISISDTGMGIDPSEQSEIFEKYSRLKKHHNVSGSGLGLHIVKSIVSAHGGYISLESQVGMGSTFTIFLPFP